MTTLSEIIENKRDYELYSSDDEYNKTISLVIHEIDTGATEFDLYNTLFDLIGDDRLRDAARAAKLLDL